LTAVVQLLNCEAECVGVAHALMMARRPREDKVLRSEPMCAAGARGRQAVPRPLPPRLRPIVR
jgi:hypothetical protein